jgi:hypothetical protein
MKNRNRFAVGAKVRVKNPGVNGVVIQAADEPAAMAEYWHTIRTAHGDRNEPGCNLELVPAPVTNPDPRTAHNKSAMPKTGAAEQFLLPEQAILLLRTQLEEPVEDLRHDDPGVDGWERITLKIVERTFGEHTRNPNHFSSSVSYPHETEEEAQDAHVQHINAKKGLIRAFIKELEIIPPVRPAVDVTRQGVFFAGQTFDALSAAARIFATTKKDFVLIDGYVGADTLNLLPTQPGIGIRILTKPLTPAVKTLCQAFSAQHGSLAVRRSAAFHDRFVVIDNAAVYHFGASVKDLGKKAFMFSLIEEPEIVAAILSKFAAEWAAATAEI